MGAGKQAILKYLYPVQTYNQAFYGLKDQLRQRYDDRESAAIAHEVMEHVTLLRKMERLMKKDDTFTTQQQQHYDAIVQQLLAGVPLQYTLGVAWFNGYEYLVDNNVLIPRPETEELVDWVVQDWKMQHNGGSILDVGTGSGCIPISLKQALPLADVTTCDISAGALSIAIQNSVRLGADITLHQLDFLNVEEQNKLGQFNVIVSNPPYIPETEKYKLANHVKDHEPGLALFVPGHDPFLFYKAIAIFGLTHLLSSGAIYCELEESYAQGCVLVFKELGYGKVQLKKDMHGNWRMLKAEIK